MTDPMDPEGLMPAAGIEGPPDTAGTDDDDPRRVDPGAPEPPMDTGAPDAGLDREALEGRTDLDRYGGDPDVRYPGDAEDPTVTTAEDPAGSSPTP